MKKLLTFLVFLLFVWYFDTNADMIRVRFSVLVNTVSTQLGFKSAPCSEPIPYTLGTFDKKFNITQTYFLSALVDAEAVWEKPQGDYKGDYLGKELFAFKPESTNAHTLKINLVYDYRQEATSTLADLGIVVKDNRASYDSLKIKFTDLKKKLENAKVDFAKRVNDFNVRQRAYGEQVNFWNSKGGAPQKEYDKLQAEKAALSSEADRLNADEEKMNTMVSEINSFVVVINRLADTLNLSVEKYNVVGASRGESFEEGVYETNGTEQLIDIYEFSSRAKLVRVLAHELGHALGLDHVDDPKAIMYKLNQGKNSALTTADLDALKLRCEVK